MSESARRSSHQLFDSPTLEELAGLLPQYEMKDFLAQGGMGAVYLARQLSLDRLVAIKVLPPAWGAEHGYAQRFQTEARAMASLRHNHVVGVYDFGITSEGHLYLVMEFVDGQTLHELIRLHRLQSHKVQTLALQLCEAIEYAHANGILHRDLKPGNVMVDNHGQLKVMDFGLARRAEAAVEEESLGTPEYSAPELLVEGALIDHRADIYALGVVFQQMLTGRDPDRERQPLSNFGSFDPAWEALIDKATAADAADRFQTMGELREAVAHVGRPTGPVHHPAAPKGIRTPKGRAPGPPGAAHHPTSTKSESSTSWLPIAVTVVLLAIGAIWWLRNGQPVAGATTGSATDRAASQGNSTSGGSSSSLPLPSAGDTGLSQPPASGNGTGASPQAATPYKLGNVPVGHTFQFQEAHRDRVTDVILLPDGYRVATSSGDGTIGVWNLHTGKRERTLGPVTGTLMRVVASPDGTHLAATGDDYHVYVWDLGNPGSEPAKTGSLKSRLCSHVLFSEDGKSLILGTSDSDQNLQAWNWARDEFEVLPGFRGAATALAAVPGSPDHFVAAAFRRDGNNAVFDLWQCDLARRSLEKQLPTPGATPIRLAISPDGKTMAYLANGRLTVSDKDSGRIISEFQGSFPLLTELVFLDKGRLILAASSDRHVRIYETLTAAEVWKSESRQTRCTNFAAVSADESYFVTVGGYNMSGPAEKDGDYAVHLWKMPDLATLKTSGADRAIARQEVADLESTDAELWSLLGELEKEWNDTVVRGAQERRKALDARYLTALRRDVTAAAPRDKEAFLSEISRVSNGGPLPASKPADWPRGVVTLYDYYVSQMAKLRQDDQTARTGVADGQRRRLDNLETQRLTSNQTGAAERVRLVKTAIASLGGEISLARITEALRPTPAGRGGSGGNINPSSPSPGTTQPQVSLVAPPMRGASRLSRPTQTGRVVLWKRKNMSSTNIQEWTDAAPRIEGAIAIAGGVNHALVLMADGTVRALGWKSRDTPAFVPAGLRQVVAIASGSSYDYALREDGSIVAWGTRSILSTSDVRPAVAIQAGPGFGMARHHDGTLTRVPASSAAGTGGAPPFGDPPPGLGPVSSVALGTSACVALQRDGSLAGWGTGRQGSEIGTIPTNLGSEVISIAANFTEAAALKQNGELVLWGGSPRSYFDGFQPNRFPGADRLVRAYPAGVFAVHFPGDGWKFSKSSSHPMDVSAEESMAQGCFDLILTWHYGIGLKSR